MGAGGFGLVSLRGPVIVMTAIVRANRLRPVALDSDQHLI
jgi:hypothetical protein